MPGKYECLIWIKHHIVMLTVQYLYIIVSVTWVCADVTLRVSNRSYCYNTFPLKQVVGDQLPYTLNVFLKFDNFGKYLNERSSEHINRIKCPKSIAFFGVLWVLRNQSALKKCVHILTWPCKVKLIIINWNLHPS